MYDYMNMMTITLCLDDMSQELSAFAEVAVILTRAAEVMTGRVAWRYSKLRLENAHVLRDEDEWQGLWESKAVGKSTCRN